MKRGVLALALVAVVTVLLAVLVGQRRAADLAAVERAAPVDDLHLEIPALEPETWVERSDPSRASAGYTLVLYRRRVPMLIDMTGRIVHLWPKVRVMGRARLGRDGRLLVIGTDDVIKQYDWDGRLRWAHRLPEGDTPHHDVSWTANGDVLLVGQHGDDHRDYLQIVDRRGRVAWEWRAADHLDRDFPSWDRRSEDPTHINSARELPPNRFFAAGDARFRPGNLLVSARNLDTVFIIDRASGEVVWRYRDGLDRQHEALMVPEGRLGAGLILVFDNGLRNRYAYRRSTVLAVQPATGEVVWRYADPTFFSSVAGSEQPLPNGNLMISSSQGGRVFEITPKGQVVWQWTPPFQPMRPERYPPAYCPQLAALPEPKPVLVRSRLGRPFVDRELHQFALPEEFDVRFVAGTKRMILDPPEGCRRLVVPPRATIFVGYGLDRARLGGDSLSASFRFELRPAGGGPAEVLLEDTVASGDPDLWRERWLGVPTPSLGQADLCIDVRTQGAMPQRRARRIVAVDNPRADDGQGPQLPPQLKERALSPQEQAVREKQLRVLGYVN